MNRIGLFVSEKRWEELVAETPINCVVTVTLEDGTEFNKCFLMEKYTAKDFESKMNDCRDFLVRTLINREHKDFFDDSYNAVKGNV